MKLSELSTDRAADVLCEITPYVSGIVTDEELLEEIRAAIDPQKASNRAELMLVAVDKISKLVPIILKKRKNDLFGILSVLNEKTVDGIAKQNFIVTMKQVRDIVRDKELIDFFKSCVDVDKSE